MSLSSYRRKYRKYFSFSFNNLNKACLDLQALLSNSLIITVNLETEVLFFLSNFR